MSDNRTFNGEAKIKLTQIVNEGMHVLHEIDTLNGGLNDTIKAVADELEIKASTLKKAIKIREFALARLKCPILSNFKMSYFKFLKNACQNFFSCFKIN